MTERADNQKTLKAAPGWKRGAVPIADLIPKVVDPLCARRGFASSKLLSAWPELVGPAFAASCVPEKIQWPRGRGDQRAGLLIIRVDGPQAVFIQHEEPQIIERINRFFGFHAIDRLKIVQGPVHRAHADRTDSLPHLTDDQEALLEDYLGDFDNPRLHDAVRRMGRGVLRRALAPK